MGIWWRLRLGIPSGRALGIRLGLLPKASTCTVEATRLWTEPGVKDFSNKLVELWVQVHRAVVKPSCVQLGEPNALTRHRCPRCCFRGSAISLACCYLSMLLAMGCYMLWAGFCRHNWNLREFSSLLSFHSGFGASRFHQRLPQGTNNLITREGSPLFLQ